MLHMYAFKFLPSCQKGETRISYPFLQMRKWGTKSIEHPRIEHLKFKP